jgi:murein DD-endopeptidase MepM/ murein hydrolase activator NlpD
MRATSFLFILFSLLVYQTACSHHAENPDKAIPSQLLSKFPKNSFAYPVGQKDYATEKNDWRDSWYNAQDFGENRHLGEDWNKSSGGNTDCGEPVYASAAGRIVFAAGAGAGWGNVIIEHVGSNETKVQSLYGHLETITRNEGEVKRREQIGTIGSANGRYPCHLQFELRTIECPMWNRTGGGYGDNKTGWIDPSEFIDKTR